MDTAEIGHMLKSGNFREVSVIPAPQIADYLLARLDAQAVAWEEVDFERTMVLGVRLTRAGHGDMDAVALEWLRKEPSALRANVVSSFLAGLWGGGLRRAPIREDRLHDFLDIIARVVPEPEGGKAYIVTLVQAANPTLAPETKDRIRRELNSFLDGSRGTAEEAFVRKTVDLGLRALEGG